jgi:hypothetical protein
VPHNLAQGRLPAHDEALLDKIGWPADGYRLYDVVSLGLANRMGFFRPFMECTCLFAPADAFAAIGGADERFDMAGGGAVNLWLWHRLAHFPGLTCVMLPGEGAVHQVHGGVTTTRDVDLEARTDAFLAQLNGFLGEPFRSPDVDVTYLGSMPQTLAPFLTYSTERLRRPPPRKQAMVDSGLPGKAAPAAARPEGEVAPRKVVNMPMGPLAEDREGAGQSGGQSGA